MPQETNPSSSSSTFFPLLAHSDRRRFHIPWHTTRRCCRQHLRRARSAPREPPHRINPDLAEYFLNSRFYKLLAYRCPRPPPTRPQYLHRLHLDRRFYKGEPTHSEIHFRRVRKIMEPVLRIHFIRIYLHHTCAHKSHTHVFTCIRTYISTHISHPHTFLQHVLLLRIPNTRKKKKKIPTNRTNEFVFFANRSSCLIESIN